MSKFVEKNTHLSIFKTIKESQQIKVDFSDALYAFRMNSMKWNV
jgi:hypothetical protein